MDDKLKVINEVPKTLLAEELGISRQSLYNKIKSNENIDEIYKIANKLKQGQVDQSKYKEKISQLEQTIKELKEQKKELQLELNSYKSLEIYKKLREKYLMLEKKYINLRARYTTQNNELSFLKTELKGGLNGENKS